MHATIDVQLKFTGPDSVPLIHIAKNSHPTEFSDAVHAYARQLRVPCMPSGIKPVLLTQRYVFNPQDGRKSMQPITEDASHLARQTEFKCMTHVRKGALPEYPRKALMAERFGTVMTRLHFSSASEAPKVSFLAEIGGPEFRKSMESYLTGLRLPCFDKEAGPVDIDVFYKFVVSDVAQTVTVFKDMSLVQLFSIVKDPQPITVDFTKMGCPFDVRLTYLQPYTQNRAVEVESTNIDRKPFLEWLRNLQLNLPSAIAEKVFSDEFTVTVPCGRIEL